VVLLKRKRELDLILQAKAKEDFCLIFSKKGLWLAQENKFITLKLTPAALRTIDKKGLFAVVQQMRKEGKKI